MESTESRNRTVWIIVAFIALVLCCCLAAAAAAVGGWVLSVPVSWTGSSMVEGDRIDQTFEVGTAPTLQIDNFAGSVTVEAGERGEIRVVAIKRASSASKLDRISVEITQQANGVAIRTRKPAGLNNASVKLMVTVPRDTYVDAHTGAGSVEVGGVERGAQIDSGAGSVIARNLGGEIDIHTGAGGVDAYDLRGRVQVDSGAGSVTIDGMDGDLDAHTGTGSIDVRRAEGAVQLDTGSGSIDYQGSPQGDCRFETGTGSITLRLPENLAADVDLHTGVGTITVGYAVEGQVSKRDVEGTISRGDEASIYAHTGAGSIDVHSQ